MIFDNSIQGALRDRAKYGIWDVAGSGVPVDGTTGTGANLTDKGSTYVDIATGNKYLQKGTKASPAWKLITTA